jgi:mitochondrial enoyl-[acyl-carrier protein] reductase / trans-2-enoyl-CoA reductase
MKRSIYEQRGPVPQDVIQAVEVEKPKLVTGQVLVEVLAAPINPSDVLTLTGQYGMLPPLPAVGGSEGVGTVVELGPDVAQPPMGQRVLLPPGSGTWSSHVVVEASKLIPLPNDADPKQLSMLTINPPTAALMLREYIKLQPGDWVIQNAANSGVGGYLIQLAKIHGYKTVNVVRRESAIAQVKAEGADVVVVDSDNLTADVKEATKGAAIRLGIDAVGGKASERLADCLGEGATFLNYGAMSGESCVISPRSFIFRDVTLKGFWLARWFRQAPKAEQMALFTELAGLIASGKLHSAIHATFTVEQIKEAIAAATQGKRDGKILIVPHTNLLTKVMARSRIPLSNSASCSRFRTFSSSRRRSICVMDSPSRSSE